MARVATTDLLLNFTIGGTSFPSTTDGTAVITIIYREVYSLAYPTDPDAYTADDADDSLDLVINPATFGVIQSECSDLVDAWHYSGKDLPKPSMILSKAAIKKLKAIFSRAAKNGSKISTFQLWGGDYDDLPGIVY